MLRFFQKKVFGRSWELIKIHKNEQGLLKKKLKKNYLLIPFCVGLIVSYLFEDTSLTIVNKGMSLTVINKGTTLTIIKEGTVVH